MSGFYVGDWGTCARPSAPEAPVGDWARDARSISIEPEKEKRIDCVTAKQLQTAIDAAIARIKLPAHPQPAAARSDKELAIALMPLLGLPVVFPEPNTLELRDAFGKTILPINSALSDRYTPYKVK